MQLPHVSLDSDPFFSKEASDSSHGNNLQHPPWLTAALVGGFPGRDFGDPVTPVGLHGMRLRAPQPPTIALANESCPSGAPACPPCHPQGFAGMCDMRFADKPMAAGLSTCASSDGYQKKRGSLERASPLPVPRLNGIAPAPLHTLEVFPPLLDSEGHSVGLARQQFSLDGSPPGPKFAWATEVGRANRAFGPPVERPVLAGKYISTASGGTAFGLSGEVGEALERAVLYAKAERLHDQIIQLRALFEWERWLEAQEEIQEKWSRRLQKAGICGLQFAPAWECGRGHAGTPEAFSNYHITTGAR